MNGVVELVNSHARSDEMSILKWKHFSMWMRTSFFLFSSFLYVGVPHNNDSQKVNSREKLGRLRM